MDALADYSSEGPSSGTSGSRNHFDEAGDEAMQAHEQQQPVNLMFINEGDSSSGEGSTGSSAGSAGTECFDVPTSQGFKRARLSEPVAGTSGLHTAEERLAEWEAPALQRSETPFENCPERHQGRKRTFPHVEGQYPFAVFIPVNMSASQLQAVQQLINAVKQLLPDLHSLLPDPSTPAPLKDDAAPLPSGVASSSAGGAGPANQLNHLQLNGAQSRDVTRVCSMNQPPTQPASHTAAGAATANLPIIPNSSYAPGEQPAVAHPTLPGLSLHISLSRTMPVRYAVLDTLLGQLKDVLQPVASPFTFTLEGVQCFENDEGTRTFLSIPLKQSKHKVCQLIRAVDQALRVYRLQEYYQDPQPHVSIAWLLGARRQEVEQALAALNEGVQQQEGGNQAADNVNNGAQGNWLPHPQSHDVKCVLCHIGTRDHVLWSTNET